MTKFTVSHDFEVPGMVLQANTPYVMRLHDSPSTRNVVQIYNADQTKMLTMFMAISAQRLEPTDKTLFTFTEMQPGFPLPIKEWFYPGRLNGLEFLYPKEQALVIAQHSRESIRTETGVQAPITETAANIPPEPAVVEEAPSVAEPAPLEPSVDQEVTEQQPVEIAQNTEPEVLQEPAPAPEAAPVTGERELPATAGELPLVALAGLLCLGAGFGLRTLSAKR